MKINLENMKELAERLDHSDVTLNGVSVGDVCAMAYQLQYFFEAMEKIKAAGDTWSCSTVREYRAMAEAYNSSALLTSALVDN